MTSAELRQRIDNTQGEIANKQARLAAIPDEKRRVLTDEKKLVGLEKEQTDIPLAIARLEERVQLLTLEREHALKTEAGVRQGGIGKEAGVVAERIQATTGAIKELMGELLAAIEGGHEDRVRYATLLAEGEWLSLRFDVPALNLPAAESLSPDERSHFLSQFGRLLQRPVSGLPWSRLTEDLRIERRRAVEREEAAKPKLQPHHIQAYVPDLVVKAKDTEVPLMQQRYGEFIKPAHDVNTENEK